MKKVSLARPSVAVFASFALLACPFVAQAQTPAPAATPTPSHGGLLSRISGTSEKVTPAPAKASGTTKAVAQPVAKSVSKTAAEKSEKTALKAAAKAEPAVVEAEKKMEIPAVSSEGYTGVLIDARQLNIQRTPSPVIYGPEPEGETLYPDTQHVPTPDEVQDASVIRYYFDESMAKKGFIGSNPLILTAVEAVGPGHDCIRLSPEDSAKLKALDKEIHFTRSWRVGILLPSGR